VINITDIDDKIIARAAEQQLSVSELSRHWEREFQRDMALLGVRPPAAWLRVSDHMEAILAFIQRLLDGGKAYVADDGVYFDCAALPSYGKLRRIQPEEDRDAEEDGETGGGKRSPRDFALWKSAAPADGAAWESPWGSGRP